MASTLPSTIYPWPLPQANTKMPDERLATESIQWALLNGILMATSGETQFTVTHCPFTLRPSPFPRALFHQAEALACPFNRLVSALSRDVAFLIDVHREVVEVDPFTRSLVELLQAVHAEGLAQPRSLSICRSDYMIDTAGSSDQSAWRLRQIEINTIASSFAALSTKVNQLHRYTAVRFLNDVQDNYLVSAAGTQVPAALSKAFELNIAIPEPLKQESGVVLFIVQPGERNIADQKAVDLGLWGQGRRQTLWRSLAQIHAEGTLDEARHLWIAGRVVVVAYYRAGYTPKDYDAAPDSCWAARLMVERSTAIKCPSLGTHLAGTKKVQQVLYEPAQLKRFLSPEDAQLVAACFAPQYALDEANEAILREAADRPHDFVLKPQREGGGNLVADDALRHMLQNLTPALRKEYVLMQRIHPPATHAAVVRGGRLEAGPLISELGIFGICIWDDAILVNEGGGFLLRSKAETQADGGVAAGVACLDTPRLQD